MATNATKCSAFELKSNTVNDIDESDCSKTFSGNFNRLHDFAHAQKLIRLLTRRCTLSCNSQLAVLLISII